MHIHTFTNSDRMASEAKPVFDSTVAPDDESVTKESALEKGPRDGIDTAQGTVVGVTLLDILDKWQIAIAWVGVLLVSCTNYLDSVTVGTYHVYALSEYNRLSIEGAMGTITGVIALGAPNSGPQITVERTLTIRIAIQGVLATLARELQYAGSPPFDICREPISNTY